VAESCIARGKHWFKNAQNIPVSKLMQKTVSSSVKKRVPSTAKHTHYQSAQK